MGKDQDLKLKKLVTSNKNASKYTDLNFSEFAKSSIPIDEESYLNKYDQVFYDMYVSGDVSHKTLIDRIYEHVNWTHVRALERSIIKVSDEIVEKENELTRVSEPGLNNPPDQIYEDGAYLIAGENGVKYPDMHTVYVVQEGRKRAVHSANLFKFVIRRSARQPEDFSGKYFVDLMSINNIPDGPPIHTFADLNIKGHDLKVDLPDILGVSSYVDVEFSCLGNEMSDYVNDQALISDMNNIQEMQFYLDNEPCIIRYIDDQYVNDEYGPEVAIVTIEKGEKTTLRLLRYSENMLSNVPSDMGQYYEDGLNITYSGASGEFINYIRQWGPGQTYPTVSFASGRIKSKQILFPENYQIPQDNLAWEIFNGLPTENTGIWEADPNITLITRAGYTGQELSTYGTRMIYNETGLWGNLGQESSLQKDVFDDPDSHYYLSTFYGQPIIRYYNDWCIIWYTYKSSGKRFRFYKLNAQESFGKHRPKVEDAMDLTMDLSGNTINGIRWDTLDPGRIRFPGLQEYQLFEYLGQGNYFNPNNGGNNYKKVSANTW